MKKIAGNKFFWSNRRSKKGNDGTDLLISCRIIRSLSFRSSRALNRASRGWPPHSSPCSSRCFSACRCIRRSIFCLLFSIACKRVGFTCNPLGNLPSLITSGSSAENPFFFCLPDLPDFCFSGLPSPLSPNSPFGAPGPASESLNMAFSPSLLAYKYLKGTGRFVAASTRLVCRPVTLDIHCARRSALGNVADRPTILVCDGLVIMHSSHTPPRPGSPM